MARRPHPPRRPRIRGTRDAGLRTVFPIAATHGASTRRKRFRQCRRDWATGLARFHPGCTMPFDQATGPFMVPPGVTMRKHMDEFLSITPMRALLACVFLTIATPGLAETNDDQLECGDRSALLVYMGQSGLSVERAPRHSSMSRSILKSLALTALTAGTFMIVAHDSGDEGVSFAAPDSAAPEFQPQNVAAALNSALAAEFQEMIMLPTQTDHKAVDALMAERHCSNGWALSVETKLALEKHSVYLNLYTRLWHLGRDKDEPWQVNIADLDYHSVSIPFNLDLKQSSSATALGKWIDDTRPTLQAYLAEGIAETVSLTRLALLAREERPTAEPIGKLVKSVVCQDCDSTDRLAKRLANRVWLQPAKRADLWRSLPLKP